MSAARNLRARRDTRAPLGRRAGFTLVEMIVVVVLGTMIVLGLYRVLTAQQRAYRHQSQVAALHDALRVGTAVLAADLREAASAGGDLAALGPDTLAVRSPVGFGIVCVVDTLNRRLGLVDVQGRVTAGAGDSVLVFRPAGWVVRGVLEVNPTGYPALACPYAAGPALQRTLRLGGSVSGVPVGAPLRAFHRYTYRLTQEANAWWLARADAGGPEVLAGPFAGGAGLEFFYYDTLDAATMTASRVARVDVRLIARSRAGSAGLAGSGTPMVDTLDLSISLRNR